MMDGISPIGPTRPPSGPGPAGRPQKPEGERTFKEILQDSIAQVNNLQLEADQMIQKVKDGEATQEQLVISMRKAQMAFETLMQIRNKLVDAFEEIQRMRI